MSFCQMMEILKKKESGKIVIVRLGAFYIATEEDAVLLHEKLDLKCNCFKNNTCKVGVPIGSLDRYLEKIDKLKYSYVVYDYDREKVELKEIKRKIGKQNKEKRRNINCLKCKGISKYNFEDKYMEAVIKLIGDCS